MENGDYISGESGDRKAVHRGSTVTNINTIYTHVQSNSTGVDNGDFVVLIGKDMSSLSSIGILVHCFHLLESHFKLFFSILLFIIVPTVMISPDHLVLFAQKNEVFSRAFSPPSEESALANKAATDQMQALSTPGHPGLEFNLSGLASAFDPTVNIAKTGTKWKTQFQVDPTAVAKSLVVYLAGELFLLALGAVRHSFVAYSVGRIQVGKKASILDAGRAFRVLWKRVFWTEVLRKAVSLAAIAFMYSPIFFFYDTEDASTLLRQLLLITMLLSYTIRLCSAFAFQLATVVPVLDEAYGLKAFGRGWRLLKGRKRVALGVGVLYQSTIALYFIVQVIVLVVLLVIFWLGLSLVQGKIRMPDPNSRHFGIFTGVGVGLGLSVIELLIEMLYAVFCISCMAFHHESLLRSSFFQKLTRTGSDHDC